jgi:Alcohol dehydrogenase, class IV
MNGDTAMYKLTIVAYRIFQLGIKTGVNIIKFHEPDLLCGAGCLKRLPKKLKSTGIRNLLVVTGKHVSEMPQFGTLLKSFSDLNIKYTVFKDVAPNPTVISAENAKHEYIKNKCDGIIAFGGGSPIDCAKTAAALIACPEKSIWQLKGFFKVTGTVPPLFAIPTTSGSGSEATVAAVITDEAMHDKFSISDIKLIPKTAVLDPELTLSLPAPITASTGMDALTHAVEAYIGRCCTKYTDENAQRAVELIFKNLEIAYFEGNNLEARDKMTLASYYAGCAFTRAFVGYVHAIAHALGGLYNIPHGLANAVVLPLVLEFYGESVYKKLAKLAVIGKIGSNSEQEAELAKRFIGKIKEMNSNMGIPERFKELKSEDIPTLATHAICEANPFYPVPKIMDEMQCEDLLKQLLP